MGNQGRSAARRAPGVPAAVMAGGKALAKSSLQLQDGAVYATVSLGVIAAAAAELGAPLHSGDGDAASGASVLVPLLDKALSMRGMLHAALVRLIQSTLANDLACMVQADVSSALTTVAGLDGWKGSAGLLRFVVGVVDAVLVALASSDAGSEAAGRARAEAGALARALASSGVPPDMLQFVAGCATVAWYKRAVVGANAKLCAAQAACAVFQFVRVCLAAAQEASPALDRSVPLLSPLLPFVVNALRGCPVEGVHVPHPHSLALDTATFDFMASGEVQRTLGSMPEPVRFKFHNCMFAKSIAAISRACASHPQLAQGPVPDAQAGAGGLGDADELMAMSNAVLAATASMLPNIGIRPMRPPPLYNEASRLAVATNKMAAGSDWALWCPLRTRQTLALRPGPSARRGCVSERVRHARGRHVARRAARGRLCGRAWHGLFELRARQRGLAWRRGCACGRPSCRRGWGWSWSGGGGWCWRGRSAKRECSCRRKLCHRCGWCSASREARGRGHELCELCGGSERRWLRSLCSRPCHRGTKDVAVAARASRRVTGE